MNEDPHRVDQDAARAVAVSQLEQIEFTASSTPFQASNALFRQGRSPEYAQRSAAGLQ
jgi:hypothetical protein